MTDPAAKDRELMAAIRYQVFRPATDVDVGRVAGGDRVAWRAWAQGIARASQITAR